MCVQVYSVLEKQIILDMCYLTESENITDGYNSVSLRHTIFTTFWTNFLDTSTCISFFWMGCTLYVVACMGMTFKG